MRLKALAREKSVRPGKQKQLCIITVYSDNGLIYYVHSIMK